MSCEPPAVIDKNREGQAGEWEKCQGAKRGLSVGEMQPAQWKKKGSVGLIRKSRWPLGGIELQR